MKILALAKGIYNFLRAPYFTSRSYLIHAMAFALPFVIFHLFGWRENTSIVAGVPPTGSMNDVGAMAYGIIYIVSYLMFVFLTPIFTLAGVLTCLGERWADSRRIR